MAPKLPLPGPSPVRNNGGAATAATLEYGVGGIPPPIEFNGYAAVQSGRDGKLVGKIAGNYHF